MSDVIFFIKGMIIGSGLTLCVIGWLQLNKLEKELDEHITRIDGDKH